MESHPIACRTVNQAYWTHLRLRLTDKTVQKPLPPGLVTHDNLKDHGSEPCKGKAASNGSVHTREQVAAAAWVITNGTEHQIQAYFLMAIINKVTSYRSELKGIFRALKHIKFLNWTPKELDQWCDNKQAVHDSMNYPYRPTDMMGADIDLVLAIHYLKSKLITAINCRHVYGHQDQGQKKTEGKEQAEVQATMGENAPPL